MKTKKERKITVAQILAMDKKIYLLQHRQAQIVKQTTPLKITLRKYIQQNMGAIEAYTTDGHRYNILSWAVDKIKCGYFGIDVNLKRMQKIIVGLADAKLL